MTGTNDKIRGLFLAVLMVVSVFAGTIALTGTAAAANYEVSVDDATENNGDITIEFNQSVESDDNTTIDEEDVKVYVRDAGEGEFVEWNASSDGPTLSPGDVDGTQDSQTDVVLSGTGTWGDLSPADEVLVNVTDVRRVGGVSGNQSTGNVSVQLSAAVLDSGDTNFNTEDSARRLYQGTPVTIVAQNDNTPFLFQDAETNQTLLEGSTGENSKNFVFDTNRLDVEGTYRLVLNPDNSPNQNVANKGSKKEKYVFIDDLELSASLEEDGRLFEHDENVTVTIPDDGEQDAVRGNSELAVEVTGPSTKYESASLNNAAEIVGADYEYGEDETDAGDYTVTVIDVQTGVSVEAGTFSVDEFPEADSASFQQGVVEEERGDVVEIPISLQNTEEGAQAFVSVGSLGDTNYVTNVTVADENGDGEVVLEFNSFMAGTQNRSAVFTAQGEDTVDGWRNESGSFVSDLEAEAGDLDNDGVFEPNTDDQGAGLDKTGNGFVNNVTGELSSAKVATLDAASYELRVAAASEGDDFDNVNFTDDGFDAQDVGAIDLGSRSTESSVVWRVPSDKASDLSLNFVDESTDSTEDEIDGNLTQTDRVTDREVIVHQITASGLEGVLKNRTNSNLDDSNDTYAFLQERDPGTVGTQVNGSADVFEAGFVLDNPNANELDREFALDDTDDFTFLPDYENNTYYVAVAIDEVDQDKLEDGNRWNATFGFEEYDAIGPVLGGEGGGNVSSKWVYEEADATLDTVNQQVEIRNLENQTITGQTNVAAGTQLQVRVQSQNDNSPFLTTLDTRVQEGNGTSDNPNEFTFTGDFSTRSAGINFTAVVRRSGTEISETYDGRLLGEPTASVTFNDQSVSSEVDTQGVSVASVTMSDGGYVVIHAEDGSVIGASSYLEAGTHEDVRIALDENIDEDAELIAMPHLDTDGDNVYEFEGGSLDAPYTDDEGNPVTDSAAVSVVVDTPVPSPTPSPTPTPTPTETPTTTEETTEPMTTTEPEDTTEPPTPTPTTADGPGFGVVVALIALLAAALLAARRRD
jgi:PGF-CTERM protein/surface glycoprotein (TIGR04207 family)